MDKKYLKVEGHSHLVRDVETNAILNTNKQDYQSYLTRRNIMQNESRRIDNIENDLNHLKSDLDEIKNLLRKIADGSW